MFDRATLAQMLKTQNELLEIISSQLHHGGYDGDYSCLHCYVLDKSSWAEGHRCAFKHKDDCDGIRLVEELKNSIALIERSIASKDEAASYATNDPNRKSPCGCPLLLFVMKSGFRKPITLSRSSKELGPSVWCGQHHWVKITDIDYAKFTSES